MSAAVSAAATAAATEVVIVVATAVIAGQLVPLVADLPAHAAPVNTLPARTTAAVTATMTVTVVTPGTALALPTVGEHFYLDCNFRNDVC